MSELRDDDQALSSKSRKDMEGPVLLNSLARATLNPKTGSYSFPKKLSTEVEMDSANSKSIADILAGSDSTADVGVDQGAGAPHTATKKAHFC
jgi:hypothetical protein